MCNMNWDRITAQDLFGELLNGLVYIEVHSIVYGLPVSIHVLCCMRIITSIFLLVK